MIVRIQGEGQWEVSGAELDRLDKIDNQIVESIGHDDEAGFESLLKQMLDHVRAHGRRLAPEEIVESDVILPPADATIDEVRSLFEHEGLIVS